MCVRERERFLISTLIKFTLIINKTNISQVSWQRQDIYIIKKSFDLKRANVDKKKEKLEKNKIKFVNSWDGMVKAETAWEKIENVCWKLLKCTKKT